jgi:tetratricopeptide (TPR) repeat protein
MHYSVTTAYVAPPLDPYSFVANNQYLADARAAAAAAIDGGSVGGVDNGASAKAEAASSAAVAAYEQGATLLANGDVTAAIAAFQAAVQLDADLADAWQLLGKSNTIFVFLCLFVVCYVALVRTNENHPP